MIPHFFVRPDAITGDHVLLGADDSRHLAAVLRARPGDRLTVADDTGAVWSGTYAGEADAAARVQLTDKVFVAPQRPRITVVHALPKQRKLDDVVQRLTELGVDRIVPVTSTRSQVQLDQRRVTKALGRWRAVALAAAKQSRRARLPVIADIGDWSTAFAAGITGVVCWEEADTGLRTVLAEMPSPDEFVVAVGPEGGLTADEVAATGLPVASLGQAILRTETAALVATAAVRYQFGLMEPA